MFDRRNGKMDWWKCRIKKEKYIIAWNIDNSRDNRQEIRKEYLAEYGDNLRQERLILKIFYDIRNALRKGESYVRKFSKKELIQLIEN